jgi:Leucine-rich repeat (LRR) protein
MKIIYLFLFFCLFLSTPSVLGQKRCADYACVIGRVKKALTDEDYREAFRQLESSEGYPNKNVNEISTLRKELFDAVENERDNAEKQRKRADEQAKIAKNEKETANAEKIKAQAAETQVKIALLKADSLFNIAETQRKKANSVLNKIYFYYDRFGLAYDDVIYRYGFIDKELNTRIDYKYSIAYPFENTGYAKVGGNKTYYLIDTLGNEYKLASKINQLDSTIEALDLSDSELVEIPPIIFENTQLKILILSKNKIQNLSPNIGKLTNLKTLVLTQNQLDRLPSEIINLSNLKRLFLSENNLTKLPYNFDKLTKLTALNLSDNKFEDISVDLGNLKI